MTQISQVFHHLVFPAETISEALTSIFNKAAEKEAERGVLVYAKSHPSWSWKFRLLEAQVLNLRGLSKEVIVLLTPEIPSDIKEDDLEIRRRSGNASSLDDQFASLEGAERSTEVDARLSFDTKGTIEKGRYLIGLYEAAGARRVVLTPPYPSTHNLGTARMAASARDGVCNKWGQTFDLPNLFVSDGAVFTTGGAENPTLTIVALAIRQGRYLAEQLSKRAI